MKRALIFFLVAFAGAGLVLACSSPDKYIGGGRNFEQGTPVETTDASTPVDTGVADTFVAPDTFVADTGPKDTGGGG